jgi:hypothetical protein
MIIASAIKLKNGKVYVGKRHGDCFKNIIEIYQRIGMDYEEARQLHFNCTQGFINDKLEFLDRTQAYYEALECLQCKEQKYNVEFQKLCKEHNNGLHIEENNWKPCLCSEDLW